MAPSGRGLPRSGWRSVVKPAKTRSIGETPSVTLSRATSLGEGGYESVAYSVFSVREASLGSLREGAPAERVEECRKVRLLALQAEIFSPAVKVIFRLRRSENRLFLISAKRNISCRQANISPPAGGISLAVRRNISRAAPIASPTGQTYLSTHRVLRQIALRLSEIKR